MKNQILTFLTICIMLISFTSCAYKPRETNANDVAIAASQASVQSACYTALDKKEPDMSNWKPDQIVQYQQTKALADANSKLAAIANKESIDPCKTAGGVNIYAADIEMAKANTENNKNWVELGKDGLKTGAGVILGWKALDVLSGFGKGDTYNADGNISLEGSKNQGNEWAISKPSTIITTTDASTKSGDSALGLDTGTSTWSMLPVE